MTKVREGGQGIGPLIGLLPQADRLQHRHHHVVLLLHNWKFKNKHANLSLIYLIISKETGCLVFGLPKTLSATSKSNSLVTQKPPEGLFLRNCQNTKMIFLLLSKYDISCGWIQVMCNHLAPPAPHNWSPLLKRTKRGRE